MLMYEKREMCVCERESVEKLIHVVNNKKNKTSGHSVTAAIGEVDDARARARQLADHFRSTYGVQDFALF
jgi:hypothetical protein